MAYTSEIEKLEKRWAENPKGRNFAPLADAYRKAGELDRAIELCKSGLERHPDYVSAHIVYGRCLVDQRQDIAAGEVFQKVLTLDPENILALRVLAEICERGKRFEEAVGWLTKLLAVDPMNGDAAEHLARAKGQAAAAAKRTEPFVAVVAPAPAAPAARAARAARATPTPTPRPAPTGPKVAAPSPRAATAPSPAAAAKPDFVVEHGSLAEPEPPVAASKPSSDIETFDGAIGFNAVAHDAARAEGLEVQEDVVFEPQKQDVEGLAQTQYESGMLAIPEPPPGLLDEELPQVDLPLIMPEDVMPAATPRAATPPPPPSPPHVPAPPPPPPPPRAATPAPAAVALSDDDGAADQAALSRAEPVLTETMAELYIKQGHTEDGLHVYQALLAQRPGDVRLRTKVDQLMGKGPPPARSGQSAQAFLRGILARRPVRGEASSLEQAFAAASPEPELPAPGEATRPASDTISLDAIFGDEGGRAGASPPDTPPPAASAAPRPGGGALGGTGGAGSVGGGGAAATAGSATGGFSFDQFFSGGGEAAPGAGGGEPPAKAPGRPSGGKGRPPVEDEAALDQFQAWLKGLKS